MGETTSIWHGISRDRITWHPTVDEDLCIGCGLCVLGCGPRVFDFDFERRKAIGVAPLRCKVGCVTCANTCPTHAIGFPSLSYLHKIIKKEKVLDASRKELENNKQNLAYKKQ